MALRIGGHVIDKPSEEVCVLSRTNGDDINIIARAVLSMEDFDQYVPRPVAGKAWSKDKGHHELTDTPQFKKDMETYGEKRFAFMAIKSLEPSNIEWVTVKLDDPSTWSGWTQDLKDAKLSETEINRIIVCVMGANSLDEGKLKEARASFLDGLVEEAKSSSDQTDPSSTSSGQPANDGG